MRLLVQGWVCCALLLPTLALSATTLYDGATRTAETDFFGYDGTTHNSKLPSNNTTPSSALSAPGEYNDVSAVDGTFHSLLSTTKNHYVQMRFVLQIDEPVATVTQIDISWTGKGVNTAPGANKDGAELYLWDANSGSFELLDSHNSNQNVVTLSGSASGAASDYLTGGSSDTLTILVVSPVKVTNKKQFELFTDYISATITSSTASTAPFGFNCVASGSDAISGTLYTRLVGSAFSFDVAALKDSDSNGSADAVETAYASGGDVTVTLELIDTSSAASCAAYPALSPAVSQTLLFTAGDAGVKSASQTVTRAYRSVGCRVTDSSNSVQGCSTDSFAIRPTGLTLASNMSNTGSSGAPVARAGDAFTLTATAVAGYDGTPLINNARLQAHAGALQTGSISGSFGAANAGTGIATGSSFVYSEVGNVRALSQGVYDSTFTSVDQPGDCSSDYSNSLVGGKVGCWFGNTASSAYFGRFTPDHFSISATQAGSLQAVCNGFAYSGQTFGYVTGDEPGFTITAENGLGTPTTTQNYTGAYNKLTAAGVAIALTEDASNLGADGLNRLAIAWTPGASLSDNGDGSLRFDLAGDSFTYTKNANAEVAPVTSDIDLVFTEIRDADDVLANGMPLTLEPVGIGIRFGRLAMHNAYGSELMSLPVPLMAEHFGGSTVGYVTNTLDQCTSIQTIDMTLASVVESGQTDGDIQVLAGQTSQASIANAPLVAGSAGLTFCPPGSPACSPAIGNTGYIDMTTSAPAHLQFDWDNDSVHDDNPAARANFGLYSGNGKQIYLREVY